MSKKIITIFGATGAQGGSLAKSILSDASSEFAVRAVTRDPNSDKARALKDLGAEIVAADIDDKAAVKKATASNAAVKKLTASNAAVKKSVAGKVAVKEATASKAVVKKAATSHGAVKKTKTRETVVKKAATGKAAASAAATGKSVAKKTATHGDDLPGKALKQLPETLAPQLATLVDQAPPNPTEWLYEIK
ncbi:MAG: NAD-dependent epimerase/dehydratase family protein, partial [Sphingobacteriales bacterium]